MRKDILTDIIETIKFIALLVTSLGVLSYILNAIV